MLFVLALPTSQRRHTDRAAGRVGDLVVVGGDLLAQAALAARLELVTQQGQDERVPEQRNGGATLLGINTFGHVSTSWMGVGGSIPAGQGPEKMPNYVGGRPERRGGSRCGSGRIARSGGWRTESGLKGPGGCSGQDRRPEQTGRKRLALQPTDQKWEELIGEEVEMRQASLDLSVELLGQEPEAMRVFHAPALTLLRDPVQMPWGLTGELDTGSEGEQVAQQAVEEQVTGTVGEGGHPLLHRGGGRPPGILRLHLAHQPPPAQTREKIERNHLLKQRDDKMPMGVKKVGQQAVRAATGLAAYSLDAEPVVDFSAERPTLVGAPADQRTRGLAARVRTAIWQGKGTALRQECCDVFFDGTEKRLYNDHGLGTPPLVVWPASRDTRREVSSFLLQVSAIILASVNSVKPERPPGPCQPLLERSINVTRHPGIFQALITLDHLFWPKEALF
jgi:hypothetical protein